METASRSGALAFGVAVLVLIGVAVAAINDPPQPSRGADAELQTLEERLALPVAGDRVGQHDVALVARILDRLDMRYTEGRDEIGTITLAAKDVLDKAGVRTSGLDILTDISAALPPDATSREFFAEAFQYTQRVIAKPKAAAIEEYDYAIETAMRATSKH